MLCRCLQFPPVSAEQAVLDRTVIYGVAGEGRRSPPGATRNWRDAWSRTTFCGWFVTLKVMIDPQLGNSDPASGSGQFGAHPQQVLRCATEVQLELLHGGEVPGQRVVAVGADPTVKMRRGEGDALTGPRHPEQIGRAHV